MWIKRPIVLFTVTIFKIWLHKENMWKRRHVVPFSSNNLSNMGIHGQYVSCYSHSSFFIVIIYKILVHRGMKIHFLLDT